MLRYSKLNFYFFYSELAVVIFFETTSVGRLASLHQVAASTSAQDSEQGRKERQTWQQAGEEPEQLYVGDAG